MAENLGDLWKVHTPNLLNEILTNHSAAILLRPLQIFSRILGQVAERALELNDDKLNALMVRLALFEVDGDDGLPREDPAKEDKNDTDDLAFLKEIRDRLKTGLESGDPTQTEYAQQMINDWIAEKEEA